MKDQGQPLRTEPLPGFLLVFSAKEHTQIKEALEQWGYNGDSDGLKEFILDEIAGERDHIQGVNLGSAVGDILLNNPELIRAGGAAVGELGRTVLGSIFKRRR